MIKRLIVLVAGAVLVAMAVPSAGAGVGASATGAGHLTVEGEYRTFAFNVKEMPDGTVQGQAQLQARQEGNRHHLELNCLRVVSPNEIVASGVFTNSSDPAFEGQTGVFRVIDNGQGRNAPPDEISLVYFTANPFFNCNTFTPPEMHPVENGNVQVRA